MPAGTILITGANGSVAAQTVRYLLSRDPEGTTTTTLLLTVRNTSDADVNTKRLREIVSQYPASAQSPQSSQSPQSPESPQCRESSARVIIKRLDLASLKDVHEFATSVAAEIARRDLPPLRGIVCNAFHWNLVGDGNGEGDGESTQDGLERTMQVNLVAHAALVLRLLSSFGSFGERIREGEVDSEGEDEGAGRIVLFTSDCHETGQNSLEAYPPGIPEDLEDLVRGRGRGRGKRRNDGNAGDHGDDDAEMVDREEDKDKRGHGFQRYANSKLAILMWTYALNRYLEKDELFSKISAVAIDPGTIADSRALRTNTPAMLAYMQRYVLQPLGPVLKFVVSSVRSSSDAGADVADLVLNRKYPGERGYFNLVRPGRPSSEESLDERKQQDIWAKTAEWAEITKGGTALERGFGNHCPE